MRISRLLCGAAVSAVLACGGVAPVMAQSTPVQSGTLIPAETFTLDNGLRVVFHIDRSDPVVAVNLTAHVGSARETPGRTGFAHMFEHLFFLDSENLGYGGLDRLSARIGGSGANGSTNNDRTDYLQTVPKDALEKMIWAEADKLGYFINTVTPAVVAKEIQVVKNEKRQSYDNQPYGFTYPVTVAALFPADHPYSWPVIGSSADLDAATIDDVHAFYRRWYTPNNATLVLAGDFDPVQARGWVEKYFGEIPRGAVAERSAPRPANLAATRLLMHEDNFAELPELTLTWPTVEESNPDVQAINMLLALLTDGKEAPLNTVLIDEKKLTANVGAFNESAQIAGFAMLSVRGFEGVDLDAVQDALTEGFARFERDGVDEAALGRIKTMSEAGVYGGLSSVLNKSQSLATNDAVVGDPTFIDTQLARLQAVTAADVMRVYETYFKGRPHIATSFVPKGQAALALEGSEVAHVVEEPIVAGAEAEIDPTAGQVPYERTASSFDRTIEPPYGEAPVLAQPVIWNATLGNGLAVSGIENDETPMVSFELSIDGGRLFDDLDKPGAANLLSRMIDRGTATKTPAELENAFKALGAAVGASAGDERFTLQGQTLARNLPATIDLIEEMLLQPRWDEAELALAKAAITAQIQSGRAQPTALAQRAFDLVNYGEDHVLGVNRLGTEASIAALTMDDLKAMLARFSPDHARVRLVGDVDAATAQAALAGLGADWKAVPVSLPALPPAAAPETSTVYFYDVPGAKQSVVFFGYPALRRADADYYPATVMNYRLGGGGFASRLTQELREAKGYTYGVRSAFDGGGSFGDFALFSQIRSNVTTEAAVAARDIMRDFGATFTEEDLAVVRSAMSKSRARMFETPGAKLDVLEAIGDLGLPQTYLSDDAAVIDGMTVEEIQRLAAAYIRTHAMNYVVVGDAETQAQGLETLGYGPVVMVKDRLTEADE